MIIIVIDISLEITFLQFVKVLGGSWAAWSFASSFWSVCHEVIGRCNCECTKSLDYVSESLWVSSIAESLEEANSKAWILFRCFGWRCSAFSWGPLEDLNLKFILSTKPLRRRRLRQEQKTGSGATFGTVPRKIPASTVQHLGIVRPFRRFRMSCFFFLEHDWILMSFWVASGEIQATWR